MSGLLGRLRCSSGQSLVEFALVVVPLLLIITGIVDFGLTISNVIGMRQGVSDGGRQAAVGQFGVNSSCTLSGISAAPVSDKQLMCLTHSHDGINNDSSTRIAIVVGDSSSSTYAVGKPVTICEEYALHSITGILSPFLNGRVATSAATVRVDVLNSTALSAAQETPLAGSSWSFCTAPAPVT